MKEWLQSCLKKRNLFILGLNRGSRCCTPAAGYYTNTLELVWQNKQSAHLLPPHSTQSSTLTYLHCVFCRNRKCRKTLDFTLALNTFGLLMHLHFQPFLRLYVSLSVGPDWNSTTITWWIAMKKDNHGPSEWILLTFNGWNWLLMDENKILCIHSCCYLAASSGLLLNSYKTNDISLSLSCRGEIIPK